MIDVPGHVAGDDPQMLVNIGSRVVACEGREHEWEPQGMVHADLHKLL